MRLAQESPGWAAKQAEVSASLDQILGDALAALEDRDRTIARLLVEQKRTRTAITGLRALQKRVGAESAARSASTPRQLPAPSEPSGEARVLKQIEAMEAGRRFSPADIARELDIPPGSVSVYMSAAVRDGYAKRVMKGLYEPAGRDGDTGPLHQAPNGISPPSSVGS